LPSRIDVRRIATQTHAHAAPLRAAASRYHKARKSLRTPSSQWSRHGLDWTNFFLADVQTGFGTFVAFYLAELQWPQAMIGVALSISTIASVLSQIAGGALADAVTWKRALVASGVAAIGIAALILAVAPDVTAVFSAEILHGLTSGLVTPAIAAISLGLVGRRAISLRTGRNYRFAAAGNALTAALMGMAGAYFSDNAIFFTAAALCIPALVALSCIRSDEIDYDKARNAGKGEQGASISRTLDLARNRPLLLFAAATVLFQFSDASMLPSIGVGLAHSAHQQSPLWMSGLIIVPQIVVALLAPWVGFHSEQRGRLPLLLLGFGVEPIRAALLGVTTYYPFIILAQALDGVSGAVIGVLTVLVIADLTAGTGRFNLAVGVVSALGGLAASISTSATGYVFGAFGPQIGYFVLAIVAAAATGFIWLFLSETKPESYPDWC
jgi:MFS family permease